jgi:hypothetical protein
MPRLVLVLALGGLLILGLSGRIRLAEPSSKVYTLYREELAPSNRAHVATFDSKNSEEYNRITCEQTRDLHQMDVRGRLVEHQFWCEKGYYKE